MLRDDRWCPSVYVMHSVRVREQMFQVSKFIQDGRWDTIAEQLRHCPDPSSRPCGYGWCQRIRYTLIYGSDYPITSTEGHYREIERPCDDDGQSYELAVVLDGMLRHYYNRS